MVLGSVCSFAATREGISLPKDKTKHLVFVSKLVSVFVCVYVWCEDFGYVLSLGFWEGGNQVVATGSDSHMVLSTSLVETSSLFFVNMSSTKNCSMGWI